MTQIITPTHLGQLGTEAINEMMSVAQRGGSQVCSGRQGHSDNEWLGLGIMNGIIGVISEVETSGGISYIVDFDGDGHRHIQDEQI